MVIHVGSPTSHLITLMTTEETTDVADQAEAQTIVRRIRWTDLTAVRRAATGVLARAEGDR